MQNFVAIGASLHGCGPGAAATPSPPGRRGTTVTAMKTYRWTILAMVIGVVLLTLVVVLLVG
jgi:hypothetical protein